MCKIRNLQTCAMSVVDNDDHFLNKSRWEVDNLAKKYDFEWVERTEDTFKYHRDDVPIGKGAFGIVYGSRTQVTKLTEYNAAEVESHCVAAELGLSPRLYRVALVPTEDGELYMALTTRRVKYELQDLAGDPAQATALDKALAPQVALLDAVAQRVGGLCNLDAKIHNWMYDRTSDGGVQPYLIDWSHKPLRDVSPMSCTQRMAGVLLTQIYDIWDAKGLLDLMHRPPRARLATDASPVHAWQAGRRALLDESRILERFARTVLPDLFQVAGGVVPTMDRKLEPTMIRKLRL